MTDRPGCQTRNHRWDKGKGEPGAKCLDCGKNFGERPRKNPASSGPAGPAPAPAPPPPRAQNEALRAKWGIPAQQQQQQQQPQPAQQQQEPQPAQTPEPDESATKVDLGSLFRKAAPELIVAGEQKTIKWCGRAPDEPNDEIKEKFDEAFEKWTRGKGKLPKIELSPGPATIVLGIVMWIQMFMTGEPMAPKKRRVPAAAPDPGAPSTTAVSDQPNAPDTSESEAPQPSPSSSFQAPRLSVVPSAGSATGAAPSSAVE